MPEERCVATSLERVVFRDDHVRIIRDAVERVHRITIDATELMSLHVTRCLENEHRMALPSLDRDWVKMVMIEVSHGKGKRTRTDESLSETRATLMPTLKPVDRSKLDQLLMTQAISIATSVRTNLWVHLQKRVFRFVRLHHVPKTKMDTESYRALRLQCLRMADDLCKPKGVSFDANEEYHDWIAEQKVALRLDGLTYKSAEANVKKHFSDLLYATWAINRALEDGGKPCLGLLPLRRQMRPAFCSFDTKAIQTLLGVAKRKEGVGDEDDDAADAELANWKRDVWASVVRVDRSKVKMAKGVVFAYSMRTDGLSARLVLAPEASAAARRGLKKKAKKAVVENAGDGSSHATAPSMEDGFPKMGLYTIDELKRRSRDLERAQIIGADPGKSELLVCVDTFGTPRRRRRLPCVRYTSAQRRHETSVARHASMEKAELPEAIADANEALSKHDSRSSYSERLAGYFSCRRESLEMALAHYGLLVHRQRAWTRFRRRQRSLTDFVRRIRGLSRDDAPTLIAYGAWGGVAGRAGTVGNKGHPPCLGRGLRSELAKHFVVVSTPEAWTSQTCSLCGHRCGPCVEADNRRRSENQRRESFLSSSSPDEGASGPQRVRHRLPPQCVRGLRRCHNENCAAHLNRDHNAAINIGRRCREMLLSSSSSTDASPTPLGVDDADAMEMEIETRTRALQDLG